MNFRSLDTERETSQDKIIDSRDGPWGMHDRMAEPYERVPAPRLPGHKDEKGDLEEKGQGTTEALRRDLGQLALWLVPLSSETAR